MASIDESTKLLIAANYFKQFLKEKIEADENIDPSDYIGWLFAKSMEIDSSTQQTKDKAKKEE